MSTREFTAVEDWIDRRAHRLLDSGAPTRARRHLYEFLVFGAKQAWACVFGAAMLTILVAARLWWPSDLPLARNDAITIAAVTIQVVMLAARLETVRELWVVLIFHLTGTAMELFKTDVGSWSYDTSGVLRIAAVPLFSGFMYAAVGSYMVRVMRLFDLRFDRWPPRWATALVVAMIYLNFFTHHYVWDLRWVLVLAVIALWGRSTMYYRVFRRTLRMPVVVAFTLVALFIWFAENIATWAGAWAYPNQLAGWHPVGVAKLVSWFLLMTISVVLVTLVHPVRRPRPAESTAG